MTGIGLTLLALHACSSASAKAVPAIPAPEMPMRLPAGTPASKVHALVCLVAEQMWIGWGHFRQSVFNGAQRNAWVQVKFQKQGQPLVRQSAGGPWRHAGLLQGQASFLQIEMACVGLMHSAHVISK